MSGLDTRTAGPVRPTRRCDSSETNVLVQPSEAPMPASTLFTRRRDRCSEVRWPGWGQVGVCRGMLAYPNIRATSSITSSIPYGAGRTSGRFVGTSTARRASSSAAAPPPPLVVKPIGSSSAAISAPVSGTPIWRWTRAIGTCSVNGSGTSPRDVEDAVTDPQARDALAQQLGEAVDRGVDAPGVTAPLEAGRGLGAQAESLGGPGDGHGREVRRLEQHLGGRRRRSPTTHRP